VFKRRFDYRALGRLKQGQMNRTEAAYKAHLQTRLNVGEIKWFDFQPIKFRLADKTFYTPDFIVINKGGEIEVHEVKGFMTDDANVKIKVAAEHIPFIFFLVRLKSKQWELTEV